MILKKSLVSALTFAAVAALASNVATAANDGILGGTSEGSLDVKITKGAAVKISGLTDITFASSNLMLADALAADDFCVFSSSGTYAISVTGLTPAGPTSFAMTSSASSDVLPYEVMINNNTVVNGQDLGGQLGDQLSEDCATTINALMSLRVTAVDFNGVAPGLYGDTLSIAVRPE